MTNQVYTDYFFDKTAFNTQDAGYVPLEPMDTPQVPLNIPPILTPDAETDDSLAYTITAQTGETQILPGEKTKTWGFNAPLLGQTIVLKRGKHTRVHLRDELPELTTFHWHGLNIPGPIADGGCHAPVYPGKTRDIEFDVNQPASTAWLHAHPCPETASQVWHGLAAMVIIKDEVEEVLPFPRNYGVDDIPVILQDRKFHDNQWNYQADYDPDGVQGPTAMINGTVNPYFDVTTQRVRLRILNGANRREWRLHFTDDLEFTQIGSDGGILPAPVTLTHLMSTCAERHEIIVDFGKYHDGDEVILYSDDTPLIHFRIHQFVPDNVELPTHLVDIPDPAVDPDLPIKHVVMSGMDEGVMIDNTKFAMQRIDYEMPMGKCQLWDITNTNDMKVGMIHPYHMHGTSFKVVSRNGHDPYPNEHGLKDVVSVNPGEHVVIKVWFDVPGIFMYHCHIIEHEDGGMMAQLKVIDPKNPTAKYQLMDHHTLMVAFAKERGVSMDELWMGGMESYKMFGMSM